MTDDRINSAAGDEDAQVRKCKTKKRKEPVIEENELASEAPVKKKRKKKQEVVAAPDTEAGESPQEQLNKKRKKNKTGFLDPQEDQSLSEQASKALYYAFSQFRKPKSWKFQKARQNWLIRNFWSESIPDTHIPLTVRYLSNVQGGVRDKLVQDCHSKLSAETSAATKTEATENIEQENPTHVRAQALLDALEAKQNDVELPQ